MQIESVNLGRRLALVEGSVVPITTMIDEWGDNTDNPAEAVSFVAGPHKGIWLTDLVSSFDFNKSITKH